MSDLISREAVLGLKTIAPIAPVINGEDVHYEEVIFVRDLEKLPSVEPEKCGDCISRKAVLEIFGYVMDYWKEHAIDVEPHEIKDALIEQYEFTAKQLNELPPVTQQPERKPGHWEWVQYDYNPKFGNWHCSECRSIVIECADKNEKDVISLYHYCPNCGAKMEVEE